jgi:hypothetical protein
MTQRENENQAKTTMMTLEQAKGWQFQHGEEIRDLAAKGDKLAQRVIAQYMVYWDRKDSSDRRVAEEATTEWIKWLNEYIVRHLTIGERDALKSKFDSHKDDTVIRDVYGSKLTKRDLN